VSELLFLAAAALLPSSVAQPQSLQQLLSAAGSGWAVVRQGPSCSVEKAEPNGVRWTSRPSVDRVAFQVVGPIDAKLQADDPAAIILDGSASISPLSSVTTTNDSGDRVRSLWLNWKDFERVLAAKRVEVNTGDGGDLAFASPGQLAAELLRACERELMLEWGVPPDQYDKIAHAPVFSGMQFFSTDDYPANSIRNEETGTVGTILKLDPDGVVKSCRIIQSSGFLALDLRSCEVILLRGRGEPARDKSGKSVDSFVYFTVRWDLPAD
jgi:TonB family protein